MKKNSFETMLYSVAGVAVMLGIVIAFNVITSVARQRVDLTHDKAYTLSEGTRAILKKLDTPVKLRFYYSSSAELTSETMFLKNYARQVQDLLAEYKQAGRGKIIVEQFDPRPDSDAEDAAQLDGIEGQALPTGEKFYLGLAISVVEPKEAIPFLRPDRERLLEYDISSAISRAVTTTKPVIGVMSGLPVFGMPSNPMMMQMGQRGQDPWTFISQLKADFDVKPVDMTTDKIDDDIKLLVVIHPREITDKAQFAIDQFLMRGGKLLAFVDAVCLMDRSGQQNPMMQLPGGGSSLDKLLKAWGIQFDTSKVVADVTLMNTRVRLSAGENPAWLAVNGSSINQTDVVTSEVNELWIPFCGAFTGTPVEGLKESVLLKSTKDSALVEAMMAAMSGDTAKRDFKPSGTEYALAIRLTGKFKTAFPNGKPEEKSPDDKPDATNNLPQPSLKESRTDTAVVLIGNSDMFSDQFCVQQMRTPFGTFNQQLNENLNLAQNIVENLAGDNNLISVRSRSSTTRPFTRIQQMHARAEDAYRNSIREYENSLQETQQKVAELQKNKEQGQRFILSPESQAELEKLRKKEGETRTALKAERKKLAGDINAMENFLKWTNILGMPAVVTACGLGLAFVKRKRTSAK